MNAVAKVVKLDIDSSGDREKYSKIVSNPNIVIESNETHNVPKDGTFIVLKYTESTPVSLDEFKCPVLPYVGMDDEIADESEQTPVTELE